MKTRSAEDAESAESAEMKQQKTLSVSSALRFSFPFGG
jgi:hypothetical protein